MKLVRLYAVLAVPDEFDTTDDSDTLVSEEIGQPLFWTAREGYQGEFAELGAEPSSWPEDGLEPNELPRYFPDRPIPIPSPETAARYAQETAQQSWARRLRDTAEAVVQAKREGGDVLGLIDTLEGELDADEECAHSGEQYVKDGQFYCKSCDEWLGR